MTENKRVEGKPTDDGGQWELARCENASGWKRKARSKFRDQPVIGGNGVTD